MAKTLKVEDYWREKNVENLLKELTQLLVRRMPDDPAFAIVEHLQKKFPKSFKITSDTAPITSKTTASNSRVQSIVSPHSDQQNTSLNDTLTDHRRLSNQSQVSGIVTIPSAGSAFTNLLKQDTTVPPEISLKNLVFANRLSQHAVRLGKDIRSDRDILEEETIKPFKNQSTLADLSEDSTMDDEQMIRRPEHATAPQLIQYKQHIHLEQDRRLHREKLAALAKTQRDKESFIDSDLAAKPEEIEKPLNIVPTEDQKNPIASRKSKAASKEEEEILNDENIFQPQRQRDRTRNRKKPISMQMQTLQIHRQSMPNTGTFAGTIVCKTCGSMIHANDHQSQSPFAASAIRAPQPQLSSQSVETTGNTIDDWFESSSNISGPRESLSLSPDDFGLPPTGSSTFRRNLFQPVNDVVEHRPPFRPVISPNNEEIKTQRLTTPRLSESGMFARSPDPKIVRPSSTRGSPTPKKHQVETVAEANNPLTNTLPSSTSSTND